MNKTIKTAVAFLALGTPFIVFAKTTTLVDVANNLGKVISALTPLVVALALLGFFWGLALYIFQTGDAEKRKKGLGLMIWGIAALFVIFSIFGIINIIQATIEVGPGSVQAPKLTPVQ